MAVKDVGRCDKLGHDESERHHGFCQGLLGRAIYSLAPTPALCPARQRW
jgi:hypothetical protein